MGKHRFTLVATGDYQGLRRMLDAMGVEWKANRNHYRLTEARLPIKKLQAVRDAVEWLVYSTLLTN